MNLSPASKKAAEDLAAFDALNPTSNSVELEFVGLVMVNGKVVQVPNRMASSLDGVAIIDWLNFTIHESTLIDSSFEKQCFSDDDFVIAYSVLLEKMLGYGITKRMPKGLNFYQKSWMLGDDYGFVCFGGQQSTILTKISGTGCTAAKHGWESRIQDFLTHKADQPRITRVDLAHDDFTGETYSVDKCSEEYDQGLFSAGGRPPNIELRGNWRNPNGKGRTVYVGARTNGKFLRVYEKGRQLGDESSEWVRIEVEMKNVDRVIPFDVLTKPGAYLAATYPAFNFLSVNQCRVETISRTAKVGYAHTLNWVKHQCGSALALVEEIEGGAGAAFDKLKRPIELKGALLIPSCDIDQTQIHNRERFVHPDMPLPEARLAVVDSMLPEPF